MSAPTNGTYYLMNDATRRSLYSDGTSIKANPYELDPKFTVISLFSPSGVALTPFVQFTVTTVSGNSTIKDKDGKYVAVDDTKPGSPVTLSTTAYNWKIDPVGAGKYRCVTF